MAKKLLATGDPLEARCTKCRKNTGHRVVTLAEENPDQVQCDNCGRKHAYRAPTPKKTSAERTTTRNREAERQEWEELRPTMDADAASVYSMNDSYRVKAVINHPTFGLGLVQRLAGPQKIEVLFSDGKKIMRCK